MNISDRSIITLDINSLVSRKNLDTNELSSVQESGKLG